MKIGLPPRLGLLVPLLAALSMGGPARAVELPPACPVPSLTQPGPGGEVELDRSRDLLARYEACLEEHAAVLGLMDPGAAQRLDRQREAAAQLKRTLDAFLEARAAAEAARGPGG